MVSMSRLWDFTGSDSKPDLNRLYKRPRIDYRVSEYVFTYIDKHILQEMDILQKGEYRICLSMVIPDKDGYDECFDDNPYDTETAIYYPVQANRTSLGEKYIEINIMCYSSQWNETIKPKEYAGLIYDMLGSYLTVYHKKITKEFMDKVKKKMTYGIIEKYKFPAPFYRQRYVLDGGLAVRIDGKLKPADISGKYLEHYGM
ncbi:MAG: hypothetical protein LBK13_11475 [Spirochaetales bacterium]|jgi:hypothetical protein|nr:hypothetical protein [Spirochaetales bacterium]